MLVTIWGKRVQHWASLESGSVLRSHDPQDLQGGDQAVAGGAVVAEDHVAALLAAEVEAVAQHFINDLPVAHGGAHDASARGGNGRIQPRVAHDGADQRLFRQRSLREQVQRRQWP